ncbi:MAG: tRNA pseudouridine(55) synthase TruB [Candidatus Omnitrophota bacterium]
MNDHTTDTPGGILVIDKEKGMTSHDVVDAVRRRFRIKKVGHAGTLDPNATGVLVLLLGKATKLSNELLNDEKEYEALMKLGERTDSGDRDGEVILSREVKVSEERVKETIAEFRGEMEQVPPMISAKKVKGVRLYKLARRGMEVERKPHKIRVTEIEVTHISLPLVRFRTVCSKGTYIRQMAEDIGEKLGCGAHLVDLRRLRSGQFSLDKAVPFSKLMQWDTDTLNENILRV